MTFFKKLFEQFFYLVILIVLELVIAYFLEGDSFNNFMTVSVLLDIFVFIGSFSAASSYSKGKNKYQKKLGVHSYTPLFYCIPQGDGDSRIFHAAGLFSKDSLIICKVSNDMSHDLITDFWESIENDVLTVSLASIKEVGVIKANLENYEDKVRDAYLRDLIRNQTIGRFLRSNQKTIVFVAFVYIFYEDKGNEYQIVFGVGENTGRPGISMLIEPALPDWINNTVTVVETGIELADGGAPQKEIRAAKEVATNIVARVNASRA